MSSDALVPRRRSLDFGVPMQRFCTGFGHFFTFYRQLFSENVSGKGLLTTLRYDNIVLGNRTRPSHDATNPSKKNNPSCGHFLRFRISIDISIRGVTKNGTCRQKVVDPDRMEPYLQGIFGFMGIGGLTAEKGLRKDTW